MTRRTRHPVVRRPSVCPAAALPTPLAAAITRSPRYACRVAAFLLLGLLLGGTRASAERLPAPQLLPDRTALYVRVGSMPELVKQFQRTAVGKLFADERVQPLLGSLYQSARDAFRNVQDQIGVPLDELLTIPQGELALAVVAPENDRPQVVLLADVGRQLVAVEMLLDTARERLLAAGASVQSESVEGINVTQYDPPGRDDRLVVAVRDETVMFSNSSALVQQLLRDWTGGGETRTLADNRKFTAIMTRSLGFQDEPPQVTWFADPFLLFKSTARGNLGAQAGLATLNGLGVDGVRALGGGIILNTEEFDAITQSHVLLGNPREGVVKMVAFEDGKTAPEPWVPADAESYTTINWRFSRTYQELTRLYDFFRGEGAWTDDVVTQLSQQLGADFEKEFVEQLRGRVTYVTWMERPARLNSQCNLVGLGLQDTDRFEATLDRLAARHPDRFQSTRFSGVTIFEVNRRGPAGGSDTELARRPEPCGCVLGDYLLLSDSKQLLQEAIKTKRRALPSLADELDYKLIAGKIQRQLGSAAAGLVSFNRPEEGFRLLYELATAPGMQQQLGQRRHPALQALHRALRDNPLPPFSQLAKYLAPSGAMLVSDETGLHYTTFSLKRE